ncbi:MAG: AsmA family protein [Candidatus Omnitrophota bacterium]
MGKKILIIGAIIFGVLIFVVVGLFIYANNIYIPKNLKPIVIEILEKTLDKHVTIKEAVYFPFKGVMFSAIDITNRDASPFLKIGKVDLKLKGFPKLKGKDVSAQAALLVSEIAFEQQALQVKGSSTIDVDLRSGKGDTPEFKAVIFLDSLSVTGIGAGIISDITQIQGKIVCTENAFFTENLEAVISNETVKINAKGKYSKNNVQLDDFNLSYVNTNLSLNAVLTEMNDPKIQAQSKGNINFADVANIISGIKLPVLKGDCVFEAQAQGKPTKPETLDAVINAGIENASIDKLKFSEFKTKITLKEGLAKLEPTTCVFYEGEVQVKGNVNIVKTELPIEISGDIQNVNMEPLVKDIMGQDMGGGFFEAHAGIYGSVTDLNLLTGGGRFKLADGTLKMPDNFKKVANALKIVRLNEMRINEASATFTIKDGKVDSQDILALSQEAMVTGKGSVDLELYLNSEFMFKLTHDFARNIGAEQFINFVSDEQGVPIGGAKVFGKIPDIKFETFGPPVGDIIKDKVKNIGNTLKDVIKQQMQGGQTDPQSQEETIAGDNVEDAIKKGLKSLFKQN